MSKKRQSNFDVVCLHSICKCKGPQISGKIRDALKTIIELKVKKQSQQILNPSIIPSPLA